MTTAELNGTWASRYTYNYDDNSSEHTITFSAEGNTITGQSNPQSDGSFVTLKLKFDAKNKTLSGVWQETTSPTGAYKGATFHGTLQLIVNASATKAEGKWTGFNSLRTKVNTGDWTLDRV